VQRLVVEAVEEQHCRTQGEVVEVAEEHLLMLVQVQQFRSMWVSRQLRALPVQHRFR
jgi:hypothetical protein